MINDLAAKNTPDWLEKIKPASFNETPLPLQNVLEESLYYPACNIDGVPIKCLGGNVHSFIYVDYGVSREKIASRLEGTKGVDFKGYHLVGIRDVTQEELTPNGWHPNVTLKYRDGKPDNYQYIHKSPFALWSVFEREPSYPPEHGPNRFSLLYIGGDGVATFNALYYSNNSSPKYLAIIQSDGFSGNWTYFRDERKILGRLVLENPNGKPDYLLYGGWGNGYESTCWPTYSDFVCYLKQSQTCTVGLWMHKGMNHLKPGENHAPKKELF